MTRQRVVQQPPPADTDLRSFPSRVLRTGAIWCRQHVANTGPWWFSSSGAGRFDLEPPRGTCYLASSAAGAVRERIGPDMMAHGVVAASVLTGRVVSRLPLPHQVHAANLDAIAAARFGVTRELPVMVPYSIPHTWAGALADAGLQGIVAGLRFSTGRSTGLALFDNAGERVDWPVDPRPARAGEIARRLGVRVVARPNFEDLTVIAPPS